MPLPVSTTTWVNEMKAIEQYELHTWFERDRQHIELRDIETDDTLIDVWLVEDGFIDPRDWKQSLYDYAVYIGTPEYLHS